MSKKLKCSFVINDDKTFSMKASGNIADIKLVIEQFIGGVDVISDNRTTENITTDDVTSDKSDELDEQIFSESIGYKDVTNNFGENRALQDKLGLG